MTTPTNHTTSSLFDFGDILEPEPSQSSLEQNSSIAESNIFVSVGGDISDHTRCSSSDVTDGRGLKSRGSHLANTTNNVSLEPLQEEPEAPDRSGVVKSTAETKVADGNGILKSSRYLEPQQHYDPEQQSKSMINAQPIMVKSDSMSLDNGFSGSNSPQPFSPTVHTSNQTPGFSKAPTQAFSPTAHTSNQTPRFGVNTSRDKGNGINKISMDNLQIDEPKIDQRADRITAWAIHIALIFFCFLIITCVLLTFKVVSKYGFVTLVLVIFVIIFFAFMACFVDNTILYQNPKLRPVRQKILTVVKAARIILEDEYHLFIRDWKECLLITQGGESNCHNITENLVEDDSNKSSGIVRIPPTLQGQRKKSKMFKLIRPFLGLKKNLFREKRRRQKAKSAASSNIDGNSSPSNPMTTYEAPTI